MRAFPLLVAAAVLTAASTPAVAQLRDYAGRWVPKELVGPDGRELTDTTLQIRDPLRPFTSGRLNSDDQRQYRILVGMAQPSRSITFAPDGATVTVTYNDDLTFVLRPDGPAVHDTLGGEVPLAIRARWEDGALQVEFEPEGGGTYIERYALADSRLYLRVDARIDWGKIRGGAGWSEMYRKVGM